MKPLKDEIIIITNVILAFAALVSLSLSYHIFKETNKITHVTLRPRMHLMNVYYSQNIINKMLESQDKKLYTNFQFQNIGKTEARNVKMTIISTDDQDFKTIDKQHTKESINTIQPGQSFGEQRINEIAYIDLKGVKDHFSKNNKSLPAFYYYLKLDYQGETNVFEGNYCQEFWVETTINKDLNFQAFLTSTKQTSSFQKLIDDRCSN